VRFLGRPWAWVALAATALPAAAAWALVALPARGLPAAERSWFLWSGNVLVGLFAVTLLFSARKWSIKLPFFRDYGRVAPARVDACFAEIQRLNDQVRRGAFPDDASVLRAAGEVLRRFGVGGAVRPELRPGAGTPPRGLVHLRKREPFGRLEPWLEVHLGVGLAACFAVLAHADFALRHPVGWTLLTLSALVLLTGVAGAVLFRVLPPRLAAADPGIPFEEAGVAREGYLECIRGILARLEEPLRARLAWAAEEGPRASPAELRARAEEALAARQGLPPEKATLVRDIVVMAGTRDHLLWSTARSRRLDLWMRLWRWVHVPVSIALVAALLLHVFLVIWY